MESFRHSIIRLVETLPMNRRIIFSALLSLATRSEAQVLYHSIANWSVEAGAGRTDIGTFYSLGISKYKNNNYLKLSPFIEKSNLNKMDYKSTGIALTYNHQIAQIYPLHLYATGGTRIQQDVVKNFAVSKARKFNAGLVGGLEVDGLLSDQILITGAFRQYHYLKGSFGRRRYDYGFGIKVLFE